MAARANDLDLDLEAFQNIHLDVGDDEIDEEILNEYINSLNTGVCTIDGVKCKAEWTILKAKLTVNDLKIAAVKGQVLGIKLLKEKTSKKTSIMDFQVLIDEKPPIQVRLTLTLPKNNAQAAFNVDQAGAPKKAKELAKVAAKEKEIARKKEKEAAKLAAKQQAADKKKEKELARLAAKQKPEDKPKAKAAGKKKLAANPAADLKDGDEVVQIEGQKSKAKIVAEELDPEALDAAKEQVAEEYDLNDQGEGQPEAAPKAKPQEGKKAVLFSAKAKAVKGQQPVAGKGPAPKKPAAAKEQDKPATAKEQDKQPAAKEKGKPAAKGQAPAKPDASAQRQPSKSKWN